MNFSKVALQNESLRDTRLIISAMYRPVSHTEMRQDDHSAESEG